MIRSGLFKYNNLFRFRFWKLKLQKTKATLSVWTTHILYEDNHHLYERSFAHNSHWSKIRSSGLCRLVHHVCITHHDVFRCSKCVCVRLYASARLYLSNVSKRVSVSTHSIIRRTVSVRNFDNANLIRAGVFVFKGSSCGWRVQSLIGLDSSQTRHNKRIEYEIDSKNCRFSLWFSPKSIEGKTRNNFCFLTSEHRSLLFTVQYSVHVRTLRTFFHTKFVFHTKSTIILSLSLSWHKISSSGVVSFAVVVFWQMIHF